MINLVYICHCGFQLVTEKGMEVKESNGNHVESNLGELAGEESNRNHE
jgi:hypothetical protein